MAFGSGALIFAVTVSIYGRNMVKFQAGLLFRYEDWFLILGGLTGCIFYMYAVRWLQGGDDEEAGDAEKALGTTPSRPVSRETTETIPLVAGDTRVPSSKFGALSDVYLATADNQSEEQKREGKQVALSLFLGLLIDGVPEGVFMGFLAARGDLAFSLIFSLFIANFPEAFSSASLLERSGMLYLRIIAMWTGLMLLVGMLTGISCLGLLSVFPGYAEGQRLPPVAAGSASFVEGFSGGAMLACIISVMLPDAQHRIGKGGSLITQAGFLTTVGFLSSLALELIYQPLWLTSNVHKDFNKTVIKGGIYAKEAQNSFGRR